MVTNTLEDARVLVIDVACTIYVQFSDFFAARRDLSSRVSVSDKKNLSPAQSTNSPPPSPCKSPRVKLQTKTEQKVQCKVGFKINIC